MIRYAVVFSTLVPFMSCSEMPMAGPDATCNCPTPNASQISYSNATSHLTSTNVQAAVDELAGKPVEPPVGPRIQLVQQMGTVTAASSTVDAACPDELHDVVLGGACFGRDTNVVPRDSSISLLTPADTGGPKARYTCGFNLTSGTSGGGVAQAICLRNAR